MSNYALVMRAYPAEYRAEHGAEIVDTANQLAGNEWSFRQSASLLVSGIRTRSMLTTHGDPKKTWAWGLAVGLITTWLATGLSILLFASEAIELDLVEMSTTAPAAELLVGALATLLSVLLLAMSTGPRVVAAIALLRTLTTAGIWLTIGSTGSGAFGALAVELAALWFIAQHGDRRGVLSGRLLSGLCLTLVGVAFLFGNPFAPNVLILSLTVCGLLLLLIDPRWTIAAAVPSTVLLVNVSLARMDLEPVIVLGVIAAILAIAHRSIHRLQTV